MIARLRRRFILITMCSVVLVLAVLMGIVNTINFIRTDQHAEALLQILADNGGSFPLDKHTSRPTDAQPEGTPQNAGDGGSQGDTSSNTFGKRPNGMPHSLTVETPYETRYFSVLLGQDGSLSTVNTGKIAAISSGEAVAMAQELYQSGKSSGYFDNYKYLAQEQEGDTLYIFLDCTRDLSSVRSFLLYSLLVSLCGILAVFLLVMALSRRAIRPVAESYDKQKQFITNAGHEIKTPLAIIDSCTEVIEMEQGESKWTQGIRGQVRRLSALTQSLISLARMDEGQSHFTMADFSLSDAALDTLGPFRLLAQNSGKHMEVQVQPDISYRGNEQTIRQLFSILADNAVKYALAGSTIHFSLGKKGKRPLLVCQNEAEGLNAGDQNVLFDRFYRGDASHNSQKGGYGIGLSMAQAIVAAHGGRIEAKSEDGASLTITVQL